MITYLIKAVVVALSKAPLEDEELSIRFEEGLSGKML